jgi:N utilization substance protein A
MASKFSQAIDQISDEKGISKEKVIETIEAALAAAFRKDFGSADQNIKVEFNPETGQSHVFDVKTVVKEITEEMEQNRREFLTVEEAKAIKKSYKEGDVIKNEITPDAAYGRIAAQTAKQVIIQRIREAEREILLKEFSDKEGQIVNGTVQRIEGRNVYVDLGRTNGILFPSEQIKNESYRIGQRIKVYVSEVKQTPKGPEIILSRAHPNVIRKLFELEVPEVYSGVVEIKAVAREAGSRSKIAVWTDQDGVDPIGSCVGQRGTRVQTIISELGGEKIDIILWNEDLVKFITNALAPAKVISVVTKEKEKEATVEVLEDQMSLAIGKAGQNVRLAAKLTGWKIDVVKAEVAPAESAETKEGEVKEEKKEEAAKEAKEEVKAEEAPKEEEKADESTESASKKEESK